MSVSFVFQLASKSQDAIKSEMERVNDLASRANQLSAMITGPEYGVAKNPFSGSEFDVPENPFSGSEFGVPENPFSGNEFRVPKNPFISNNEYSLAEHMFDQHLM